MGYTFFFPRRNGDLDEIWLYIARSSGSVDIANRAIEAIARAIVALGLYPEVGKRRFALRTSNFSGGRIRVVYRIESADAAVLQVIRGSRDVEASLRRL